MDWATFLQTKITLNSRQTYLLIWNGEIKIINVRTHLNGSHIHTAKTAYLPKKKKKITVEGVINDIELTLSLWISEVSQLPERLCSQTLWKAGELRWLMPWGNYRPEAVLWSRKNAYTITSDLTLFIIIGSNYLSSSGGFWAALLSVINCCLRRGRCGDHLGIAVKFFFPSGGNLRCLSIPSDMRMEGKKSNFLFKYYWWTVIITLPKSCCSNEIWVYY